MTSFYLTVGENIAKKSIFAVFSQWLKNAKALFIFGQRGGGKMTVSRNLWALPLFLKILSWNFLCTLPLEAPRGKINKIRIFPGKSGFFRNPEKSQKFQIFSQNSENLGWKIAEFIMFVYFSHLDIKNTNRRLKSGFCQKSGFYPKKIRSLFLDLAHFRRLKWKIDHKYGFSDPKNLSFDMLHENLG